MEAVFFDFDGVILDSVNAKTEAFGALYAEYGDDIRLQVVQYHLDNGGMSRFEKFRYYHEELLGIPMTQPLMDDLCDRFNVLSLSRVMEAPFIAGAQETLRSLKEAGVPAFVASGTPQKELEATVAGRELAPYFVEVHGSPRKKSEIVADVLERHGHAASHCAFIGDAMADYNAARDHAMPFVGVVTGGISIFPKDTYTINALSHEALALAVNR